MPAAAHTNGAIGQKPWNLKRTGSSSSMDFASNHAKPPNSASITSAVHSDPQPDDYWSRYQQIKSADQTRNALIEDLMYRVEYLATQYRKECEDHERDREFALRREPKYQENILRLQMLMDQDPFVLVLIDGDGMIFREDLLNRGEAGGQEAAQALHDSIVACIHTQHPDFPSDTRIAVRVYGNVQTLGDACYKAGLLHRPSTFSDFAKGFTGFKELVDFIDVGSGTMSTNVKVAETLRLHLFDYHCRQIFFGGSCDDRYTRLLDGYAADHTTLSRLSLLEGPPLSFAMQSLPYHKRKLGNLFGMSSLDIHSGNISKSDSFNSSYATCSAGAPMTAGSKSGSQSDTEAAFPRIPSSAVVGGTNDMTPQQSHTQSSSISTDSPISMKPSPAFTWASAVSKPAPADHSGASSGHNTPAGSSTNLSAIGSSGTVRPLSIPEPPALPEHVPRNRRGQRIDPVIKHDKEEVDRVKRLKLCNVHFLRRQCPYGDGCSHDHKYRPTLNELKTLSLVARMAPCVRGSECEDPKCLYGHHCMAPEGREKGKLCIFGDGCKFPRDLHGIDRVSVKVVRV
ncbi:MAG: hypothetical protein M1831_004767 [Alyxoria varia]|nr:MAG: hypothetical protein M1831_004767 [Alyxoria varia]